ncbi:MAG: SWIM zinc finger family protein, partial [Polyangiales bacterium]
MPVDLDSLRSLLATIRKRTPSMRAAEANRILEAGAVMVQREGDDEAMLVLQVPGWSMTPTVFLYPDDEEWTCDCGGSDPCAHVLAGAIALERARAKGGSLPSLSERQSRLRYTLRASGERLFVDREAVTSQGATTRI